MAAGCEADVIVIGGGGAGLAAAAEAARLGREVVLLEKQAALGGSTAWSVGSISASGTPHQRRLGIADSPQAHFEDLELLAGALAPRDNRGLRRILVDGVAEAMDWLMSVGLEFAGPMPEPPHRVPRMHNVLPNARAFPYWLGRHCRRLGVDIRLRTAAVDLLSEAGRIAGVVAEGPDGRRSALRARCGVILAAGDYSGSRTLKARFATPEVAEADPVNPHAGGDGFALGLGHGARMVNGDIVRGPIMRLVPPLRPSLLQRLPPVRPLTRAMRWSFERLPPALLRPFALSFIVTAVSPSAELFRRGAILVNAEGRRFGDELDRPGHATARQPGRIAWLAFDAATAGAFSAWPNFISTAPGVAYAYLEDYRRNRPDIFHRAATLEALASSMGVPPGALAEAVRSYNEGTDAAPRSGPRQAIAAPPFVALGPVRAHVVFTDGGLAVTERMGVIGGDGAAIAGLYAAGANGQGGVLLEGHGHHLGWAFVSGRIAGRAAASEC